MQINIRHSCLCLISFLGSVIMFAQPRKVIDFNKDWKFLKGDDSLAKNYQYNDSRWRTLNLPHDWSIESDFTKDAPATNQGGSLPGGIGWYRKTFTVTSSEKQKRILIAFDGVYKNSEVWINGHLLGKRPNGYVNFDYDLSSFLRFDQLNVIAVKVDNSLQPDSRWYSGSGIYRDVKLIIKNRIAVKENGVFITPQDFTDNTASLNIHTTLENYKNQNESFRITHELLDATGKPVKDIGFHSDIPSGFYAGDIKDLFTYKITNPVLWSIEKPYLYTLRTRVYEDGKLVDEVETKTGFRTIGFNAEGKFQLNGKPVLLKGVCLHHDLGALGAAFNKEAARRQLMLLKEMGCNAIRCSHNPPAAGFLDLCDEMGFLVMDEAFDTWNKKKNKYDYHQYFNEWYTEDLKAMVLRDRNHPSVFMWSIGNEIRNQFDSSGTRITRDLVSIVKELDPTRPVTCAMTETVREKNFIAQSNALDVLGFNYKDFDYAALPARFPGEKFIATETASALETRGVYQFPSDTLRIWPADYKEQDTFSRGNKDYTTAAYDNTHAYWGNTHEKSWLAVKRNPHMSGLFVWSGFDYLGEPLPYPSFPARSSYYGIIDLAGFPKDVYYMYQSEWTDKPVLHVFPHWSWKKGDTVDVWAYYNQADAVELFLNGKSLGKKSKTDTSLHVSWRIPFEPGLLKAVSYLNGKAVLEKQIKTAGPAARVELTAHKTKLKADGKDLVFITARITDAAGNTVTGDDRELSFSIRGAAIIAGTDNGYPADTRSLKNPIRKTWKGLALVIVQSSGKKGNSTVTVSTEGLPAARISLRTTVK